MTAKKTVAKFTAERVTARQYWAEKKKHHEPIPTKAAVVIKAVGFEQRMQHFGRVKLLAREIFIHNESLDPCGAWDCAEDFYAFADAQETKARAGK